MRARVRKRLYGALPLVAIRAELCRELAADLVPRLAPPAPLAPPPLLTPYPTGPPPARAGAIYIESDKNSRARNVRVVAMAGQYSALCIASGVRSQELWGNFLHAMALDQNAMVAEAQATLTGQTSMHGIDAVAGSNVSLPAPSSALAGGAVSYPSGATAAASVAASPARAAAAPPAAPTAAPAASGALFVGSSATEPAAAPAPAAAAAGGGGLFGGDASVDL